jgi:hypothetical protein
MSKADIISELPKLSQRDRREIARKIIDMEAAAGTLDERDHAALEWFQMLDAMEAEDGKKTVR